MDVPEVMNSVTNQEKNEKIVQQVQEAAEPTQNGLNSTSASEASTPVEKTISFEQNRLVMHLMLRLSPLDGAKHSVLKF